MKKTQTDTNPYLCPKHGRHTLKDWLELLWATFLPPKRRLGEIHKRNKAFLKILDLDTLEHSYHAIWFGRTELRCLKAELRRRTLKAILYLLLQYVGFAKSDRLEGHRTSK